MSVQYVLVCGIAYVSLEDQKKNSFWVGYKGKACKLKSKTVNMTAAERCITDAHICTLEQFQPGQKSFSSASNIYMPDLKKRWVG